MRERRHNNASTADLLALSQLTLVVSTLNTLLLSTGWYEGVTRVVPHQPGTSAEQVQGEVRRILGMWESSGWIPPRSYGWFSGTAGSSRGAGARREADQEVGGLAGSGQVPPAPPSSSPWRRGQPKVSPLSADAVALGLRAHHGPDGQVQETQGLWGEGQCGFVASFVYAIVIVYFRFFRDPAQGRRNQLYG